MKLYPPDAEVVLYETGFGSDDSFNRKSTGKSLSELVDRIEDPLVIALDGEWGSGKTWFLKRWVGSHKKENNGKAITVYFDAFLHDFMDDPLIALTGVIGEKYSNGRKRKVWSKVKSAAATLARSC
jgi:predicted KAP-like P-loop ATPase